MISSFPNPKPLGYTTDVQWCWKMALFHLPEIFTSKDADYPQTTRGLNEGAFFSVLWFFRMSLVVLIDQHGRCGNVCRQGLQGHMNQAVRVWPLLWDLRALQGNLSLSPPDATDHHWGRTRRGHAHRPATRAARSLQPFGWGRTRQTQLPTYFSTGCRGVSPTATAWTGRALLLHVGHHYSVITDIYSWKSAFVCSPSLFIQREHIPQPRWMIFFLKAKVWEFSLHLKTALSIQHDRYIKLRLVDLF